MTAKVGFPTLRLIRIGIEALRLDGLQPGEWRRYHNLRYFQEGKTRLIRAEPSLSSCKRDCFCVNLYLDTGI